MKLEEVQKLKDELLAPGALDKLEAEYHAKRAADDPAIKAMREGVFPVTQTEEDKLRAIALRALEFRAEYPDLTPLDIASAVVRERRQ